MKKFTLLCAVVVLMPSLVWAWGGTGHKLINRNAVIHLPGSMQQFIGMQAFFEAHASDADNRKNADPTEGDKHFIDIDYYPNFQNKVMSYDSLKALYGVSKVTSTGTLPWVTVTTLDSLTAQLRRGDTTKAFLTASDLGHYVGDGHQPLHLTQNFNVDGMHSRYESSMLDKNLASIKIVPDSVRYVGDPLPFVFRYIDTITPYSDSINAANARAKAATGSTSSTQYYESIWSQTGKYTNMFIQQASVDLASLWYTAWINAGLLTRITDVAARGASAVPAEFMLAQNYPNPFNPSTTVRFTVGSAQMVTLDVYDMLGRSVTTLVQRELQAGTYTIQWNASGVPSGVYYCRLAAGSSSAVRKMILQK